MKLYAWCLVLLLGVSVTKPAMADLRPPPLVHPESKTPPAARLWVKAAQAAMASKDPALGEKLCDPRGYKTNLVGGSGNPLESLFAQGMHKEWHLALVPDDTSKLRHKALILRTHVTKNEGGKVLDEVYVLLIQAPEGDEKDRWVALGAGEKREQVMDLALRFLTDKPLEPPAPTE